MFSNTKLENFSTFIYLLSDSMKYSALSPKSERISLYPFYPLFLNFLFISSQSIMVNLVRFAFICFPKVDFPVAIPPVRPNILTLFSFLPIKKIKIHGKSVVKNGFISKNIVFAKIN